MELIFYNIEGPGKKEWLLHTLKFMDIGFKAIEKPQTLTQYNEDLAIGDAEIERGEFLPAEALKIEASKW